MQQRELMCSTVAELCVFLAYVRDAGVGGSGSRNGFDQFSYCLPIFGLKVRECVHACLGQCMLFIFASET